MLCYMNMICLNTYVLYLRFYSILISIILFCKEYIIIKITKKTYN